MRLTDIRIKSLKVPETGQKTYFDDSLRGFGVRVSQGGAKSFVVMYGKKRQLKTLGRYPDLSLADARKEAKRIQVEAFDFMPDLVRHEPVPFELARDRYLADCKTRSKERTYLGYHRLLHRHFSFRQNSSIPHRALENTANTDKVEMTCSNPKPALNRALV